MKHNDNDLRCAVCRVVYAWIHTHERRTYCDACYVKDIKKAKSRLGVVSLEKASLEEIRTGIDIKKIDAVPLARCTFCVKRYGDAPKTDNILLVPVSGSEYLACKQHRRGK